jgi:hypothetical protein
MSVERECGIVGVAVGVCTRIGEVMVRSKGLELPHPALMVQAPQASAMADDGRAAAQCHPPQRKPARRQRKPPDQYSFKEKAPVLPRSTPWPSRPRQRDPIAGAVNPGLQVGTGRNSLAFQFIPLLFAPGKVAVHLGLVIQVKRNRPVDLGQTETFEVLADAFRRASFSKRVHDCNGSRCFPSTFSR